MKTAIIFSILLLPAILWGQITNHFDNLNSKWNVAKTYPAATQQNPNFVTTTTTVYGFQGDTVINSKHWFKIYSTIDSLFQNNLVYRGLLRTENNKVLYLDTLNQLDTLYDFNLNLGDSVLFNMYGMYSEWLHVINVDSIQISGEYYKRLKFDEPTLNAFDELNEIWIEGIGSIHGPLFPNFPVKFSQEIPDSMLVTCTFSDNKQVWQHPSFTKCYVNVVLGVDILEIGDFRIYPNPFSDKIYIENSRIADFDMAVLNSLGQVIRQMQIESGYQTIDLAEMKAGIYFLTISDHGKTKTMKIIKQH